MESKEGKVEQLLKKYLREKVSFSDLSSSRNCPPELELHDYLEGRLSRQRENLLLEHIADCPHCLSLLEIAQGLRARTDERPRPEMIMRAKHTAQKRPNPPATDKEGRAGRTILNYKWQLFAGLSFILSFIFTRYFLQFLVLAVIFSLKWLLNTGSTRTLIMIYEAWHKKDKGTARRIIQDFEDKIGQRR